MNKYWSVLFCGLLSLQSFALAMERNENQFELKNGAEVSTEMCFCSSKLISSQEKRLTWPLKGRQDCELLIKIWRNGAEALRSAIDKGCDVEIMQLLNDGADPNEFDHEGFTALHVAIISGKFEIFKLLLVNGADPSLKAKNFEQDTPLTMVLSIMSGEKRLRFLKQLLDYGADLSISNKWRSPLHLGVNDLTCAMVILDEGLNENEKIECYSTTEEIKLIDKTTLRELAEKRRVERNCGLMKMRDIREMTPLQTLNEKFYMPFNEKQKILALLKKYED